MKLSISVPLHVSGIWVPVLVDDLLYSGSIGAGLNLSLYLKNQEYYIGSNCEIVINDKKALTDHARYVCKETGLKLVLRVSSPIDLGKGYAVSASAILVYSLLLGLLRNHGSLEEYAGLAHKAEIIYKTGLGDVTAIFYGGAEIRVKPGAPGIGIVKHIVVHRNPCIIACVLPGVEDTPLMLQRISSETYSYGKKLLDKLISNPSLADFFEYAQLFTRRIFNYDFTDKLLDSFKKKIIGYYRKKQALIIWVEQEYGEDVIRYLVRNKLYCLKTSIDTRGVSIVYTT